MVFDRLVEIISEQLEVDRNIVKKSSFLAEDLGADSLDLVDLVMSIEDEYGIELPDSELEKIKTVSDLCDFIESRI
ncbi:MAG: acyl carrier protein [Clostridiales bacterium]|nr:acyl carrier protein [Clostridiales bacterium]